MKVIAQEAIAVEFEWPPLLQVGQRLQKGPEVGLFAEHVLAIVPAVNDVVNQTLGNRTQRTRHRGSLSPRQHTRQANSSDPFLFPRTVYSSGNLGSRLHYYYNKNWQVLEQRREISGTEDPDPRNQYLWHPYYIDALAVRSYDPNTTGTQTDY